MSLGSITLGAFKENRIALLSGYYFLSSSCFALGAAIPSRLCLVANFFFFSDCGAYVMMFTEYLAHRQALVILMLSYIITGCACGCTIMPRRSGLRTMSSNWSGQKGF